METKAADMRSVEEIIKRNLMARTKLAKIIHEADGTVRYECVECPAQYYDKEKLELHLCKHNDEYRYLCGICGTGLKRKEHLERHTQEHLEVRPYSCHVCGKAFKRKEHLNIHLAIHSGGKPLECEVCQKTFYRKDHLQKHMLTHNKHFLGDMLERLAERDGVTIKQEIEEEEFLTPIITSVSGSVGDTKIKMEIPDVMEDSEGDQPIRPVPVINDSVYQKMRPYVCNICNKRYKRRDHLKVHSKTHMKKTKVCSECGLAFHYDGQLLSHINSVHLQAYRLEGDTDGIARLKIMLGDKAQLLMASDGTDLLVPRVKKTSDERPHVCHICNRKFKRKQHLKVHGNVHMRVSQPTIWCSLCNEGFFANDQFERHKCTPWERGESGSSGESGGGQTTHEAKKENICSQDYVEVIEEPQGQENGSMEDQEYLEPRQSNDEVGDVGETGEMGDVEEMCLPVPRRVYVCKYCTKPFKRKDHFKIHLHIHTGIKSFFCPVCGKGFYRKDHLQKHTQVHSKTRPARRRLPDLYPISMLNKEVVPEITIHAPSNTKLRVPLQIKVPYQMVMSMDNGEQRAITIDPQASTRLQ
ncbi:zinc finger protein 585A isoform X1 [Papilio machaon]|uniref:zinc finger protein 585A isoform X1 n=1 Tax=Papilio machaon TaxID=76193 RepID=UPI001E66423C|nr:zinc finger protein 585A isoform X1 [Papilio machaon]XP_045535668.1 zinc finger protein 585A isoform X1 [Papilio machaon]